MNVGLHHDREQGLIDPAAPLQQRREERPLPQLRNPQLQLTRGGRKSARTGPVALRDTIRSAFERGGTDERGRFRIDQLLIERLGRNPDSVGDIGEFKFPEQLEEGRLVKSHRAYVSFREIPRQFSLTIARWLTTSTTRHSSPRITPPQGTPPPPASLGRAPAAGIGDGRRGFAVVSFVQLVAA